MHKKLLELGFKRCEVLKLDYTNQVMVPDNVVIKTEMKNGKWVTTQAKKIHPKWNGFYRMVFSETIKIFILLETNKISRVYMSNKSISSEIYNIYSPKAKDENFIISKGDIIKLFPKEMQRDFVINSLFA